MPKLTLNRNFTMTSKSGHAIKFVKGEPTFVPLAAYNEAIAIGAQPSDGSAPDIQNDKVPDKAPSDPAERAPHIRKAIEKIIAKGEREDFMASGMPHHKAVSAIVGFRVDSKEVQPVWHKYQEDQAAPAE